MPRPPDPSLKPPPGLSPPGWIGRARARLDGWELRVAARGGPRRDARARLAEWMALAYALGLAAPLALATSYSPALWASVAVYHAAVVLVGWPLWARLGRPSRVKAPARLRRRAVEVLEALEQLAPGAAGAVRLDDDGAFELRWACAGGLARWRAPAERGAASVLVVEGVAEQAGVGARLRERLPPELAQASPVEGEGEGGAAWRVALSAPLDDAPGAWGAVAASVVAALDRGSDPLEAAGVARAWAVEGRGGRPALGPGVLVWPAVALGLGLACAAQAGAVTTGAWGAWAATALAWVAVLGPAVREARKLRAWVSGRASEAGARSAGRRLVVDAAGVGLDDARVAWGRPFVSRVTQARGFGARVERAVPWVNVELFQDGARLDVSARLSPAFLRERPAQLQRSGAVIAPGAWLEVHHNARLMARLHGHGHGHGAARGAWGAAVAVAAAPAARRVGVEAHQRGGRVPARRL